MNDTVRRVPAEALVRMVARIFEAAGGSATEAEGIARSLVAANLAGHDSHGVIRTERYVMWVGRGILNFGRHVETVLEGPGFALLEGHHGFGQTIGPESVEVGVGKARAQGFAVVGLRRSGHLGRIGGLAEIACAAGLVSIHFVNVANSVFVAPFGGAARRMSTAPVCIGVPQEGGDFLLDFATSRVAEGKVLVARKARRPAPAGSLVGPDGRPGDDPALLYGPEAEGAVENPRAGPGALVAMGEHKGSGLALACELLAGALTGSGTAEQGSERSHNGMLSIYLDPDRLDDGHGWRRAVADYIAEIRACPPADAATPVLIPGDPERRHRAERQEAGIPLDAQVWESLMRAGAGQGLERGELAALARV
ncbi:MAG TPA: Ldh family oxidoreductase [Thermohalobaculum sp.]|nr:Ldh family oxidoreductase [Thermohalobaculum sp.]